MAEPCCVWLLNSNRCSPHRYKYAYTERAGCGRAAEKRSCNDESVVCDNEHESRSGGRSLQARSFRIPAKSAATAELITAVREILKGKSYLSPQIAQDTVDFLLGSGKEYVEEKRLTQRQREVLQLFAEGWSMKEMPTR